MRPDLSPDTATISLTRRQRASSSRDYELPPDASIAHGRGCADTPNFNFTPLSHLCHTSATPLPHLCRTCVALCHTSVTPLSHLCHTSATPLPPSVPSTTGSCHLSVLSTSSSSPRRAPLQCLMVHKIKSACSKQKWLATSWDSVNDLTMSSPPKAATRSSLM